MAMHGLTTLCIVFLVVFGSGSSACAEQNVAAPNKSLVSDWMDYVGSAFYPDWSERTPKTARAQATVALAMFEAANSIEQEFPSFLGLEPVTGEVMLELAVAQAAGKTLASLFPERSDDVTGKVADMFGLKGQDPINNPDIKRALSLGDAAAEAAVRRATKIDEAARTPYRTAAPAGVYVPTMGTSAISDFDLALEPWALSRRAAARPPAPLSVTSAAYARDLDEVRRLGASENSDRTPEETETARFWFFIDLKPVLKEISLGPGRSHSRNARLYALFHMATDDAWIASADGKAHYQFWRPITAIRNADRDGNTATIPDHYWTPLLSTPSHPEYPCAHCVEAAARAVVLKAELADKKRVFKIRSSTIPEAPARSVTIDAYVEQTSLSRIYAGAHYHFSNTAGEAAGRTVGNQVLARWPTSKSAGN